MSQDEARSKLKPQDEKETRENGLSYFFAVCILFVIAIALGVNSLMIYKYYRNAERNAKVAYLEIETIKVSKGDLLTENEMLKNKNKKLEDSYKIIQAQNKEILKQIEEIKKQNDQLVDTNDELTEDNIALQNSLKKAASVGIKPQSFSNFNGITSRGEIKKGKYVGKFLGTAYTPSSDECGNSKGITNSGHPIVPGISIAIDNKYWPFGTVFYIKGLGYAVAMDTGSAIKGKNRFDFAVFDKNFAKILGSKYWDVFLVKLGNGNVGKISF